MVAIEFLRAPPGGLQAKDIGVEAHDDAVLFTQAGHLGRMPVKGAEREIDRNLIDNVAPQKFRQPRVVAHQLKAALAWNSASPGHSSSTNPSSLYPRSGLALILRANSTARGFVPRISM